MIDAKDVVVWVNDDTKEVMVRPHQWAWRPENSKALNHGSWCDPIGAAYEEWNKGTDEQRVRLMLETVLDLAMQGYPLKMILTVFAEVREFRALGNQSYPMCRALTATLVSKCLEPNTMGFEELLKHYAPEEVDS